MNREETMNTKWIAALLAAMTVSYAGAAQPEPDVVVFFHHGTQSPTVVGLAEVQATNMLATAGVTVAWRLGSAREQGHAEIIEAVLTEQADPNVRPGAMAFATLGVQAGTRIEIYYNRVRMNACDEAFSRVLAHVLVHEITHVLEGVERHSASGVMKARFAPEDLIQMRRAPLSFATEDLALIRAWSEKHNARLVAGLR
jgi:hypothetical protein